MSDLRTRIAATIRREVPCHPPAADRIADAVIAELSMTQECSWHVPVSKWVEPLPKKVRYVTDWKADE